MLKGFAFKRVRIGIEAIEIFDADFDHLNNYFLQPYKLEPKDLRKYLAN